jgi:hypothetical protein
MMIKAKFFTASVALAAIVSFAAPAAAAALIDVSFEQPSVGGGYVYSGTTQPYTTATVPIGDLSASGAAFTAGAGIQANGSAWGFAAAPQGTQTAFIQSYDGVAGSISITLSGLTSGKEYFVSFDAAQRPGYGADPLTFTAPGVSTDYTVAGTAWKTYQTSFVADSTSDVLTFAGAVQTGDTSVGLDAITVAVPEPATWAMMLIGFGMVGCALRARRRQDGRLAAA